MSCINLSKDALYSAASTYCALYSLVRLLRYGVSKHIPPIIPVYVFVQYQYSLVLVLTGLECRYLRWAKYDQYCILCLRVYTLPTGTLPLLITLVLVLHHRKEMLFIYLWFLVHSHQLTN